MGHTPGPWAYDTDSKEVFSTCEDHGCGWVALVAGNDSEDRLLPDEMRLANARLIAAAPELLAVCKAIASDLSLLQFTDGEYRLTEQSAGEILQFLREVIAKAEGGGNAVS